MSANPADWRAKAEADFHSAALQPGAVLLRYPDYSATAADARAAIESCTRLRASLLPHF
ncbi:MAG: hypothetical protein ACKVS8_04765 [Phycisphaerales bacterium]